MAKLKRHKSDPSFGTGQADGQRPDQGEGSPPSDLAAFLAATRAEKGLSLDDMVKAIRIRRSQAEAIEAGRFDDLPGRTYALGFVRAYAEHLGLDGNEMVRRFKAEAAGGGRRTELNFPSPLPEGRFPGRAMVLASLILVVAVYVGWRYLSVSDTDELESGAVGFGRVTSGSAGLEPDRATRGAPESEHGTGVAGSAVEASPRRAARVGAESADRAPSTAEDFAPPSSEAEDDGAAEPSVAPEAARTSGESSIAKTGETTVGTPGGGQRRWGPPSPESIAPQASAATWNQQTAAVYGAENLDARIVLRASADCWVEVRDPDDKVLFMRILYPGESYRVPDRPGLRLTMGNAGGLEILVDGASLTPLGPSGAVRKNIPLEPDLLLGVRG